MIDSDLVDEIVATTMGQGELSKQDVLRTWSVAEGDYAELQKAVLSREKLLEKGPPKVGGFAVRRRKGVLPVEESAAFTWAHEWERATVDRLVALLSHAALEDLLGPLRETVRQTRTARTGVSRRSNKTELSVALLLNHGVDLFLSTDVRTAVGRAAKVETPAKWHSGKRKAIEFVKLAAFPPELAGLPTDDAKPDYEYLEGRFAIRVLQPFQKEVKDALVATLGRPGDRAIVTLPTGGGKTRVAVESIKEWLTGRYDVAARGAPESVVLWLAHTEELCEQAYASFRQVWEGSENVCPLVLVRFWGQYTQDLAEHRAVLDECLSRPSVLISTPQRIVNLLDGRIDKGAHVVEGLRRALGLLLVDEAHRAAAPSYRRIFNDLIDKARPVAVAGLTATPFRTDYGADSQGEGAVELKKVFQNLIEPIKTLGPNPRQKLQAMKVLATPTFQSIKTSTTLRMPTLPKGERSEEDLELIDRALAIKADNTQRRLAILAEIKPLCTDPANTILYFGPTVGDAESMAYLLRSEGIAAAVVSGKTRSVTRRQVIAEFKKGDTRVLCNCEVLTTGFDAPRITHVVMARPTVSRVLYEQIVGRGLRGSLFGGTDTCVILDCEDDFKGERPELGYERFRKVWTAGPVAR